MVKKLNVLMRGVFGGLLILGAGLNADVVLPTIISDHMVMQHSSNVNVWGWAEPSEKVAIKASWLGQVLIVEADRDGRWLLKLSTPKAGERGEIEFSSSNTIKIKDIAFGEVWLCCGQSNMEMPLKGWAPECPLKDSELEVQNANYDDIRLLTVPKAASDLPLERIEVQWQKCSSESAADFSATGYFFGRELHKKLGVPVGLINSSFSGTFIESWMKREVLMSKPEYSFIFRWYKDIVKDYPELQEEYGNRIEAWKGEAVECQKSGRSIPPLPVEPFGKTHSNYPTGLYNAMIAPVEKFTVKGVIWYQGESNVNRAYQYASLFKDQIRSWRENRNYPTMPFYFVQVTPYAPRDFRHELWPAQLKALELPYTGMVVTTDIGDPTNIHPANKQDVGKRLAMWAFAKDYGFEDVIPSGPIYKSMEVLGDEIKINFDYAQSGLVAKGGELGYFEVAGSDNVYYSAKARIEGQNVVVSCAEVEKPVNVRFGWKKDAQPNLFNEAMLPASPFKTDDWGYETEFNHFK